MTKILQDSSGEELKRAHKFAIFCIARIGSQIYDTSLVHPVDDLSCADVSFTDVVEFSRVAPHFEMTVEVYAHALDGRSDDTKSSSALLETPQKIARSISKAVGKKVAREALDHKGPKFEMVASVTLSLDECNDGRQMNQLSLVQ